MRLIFLILGLFSLLVVSGCSLHEASGEIGGVEVKVKDKDGGGDGDFCPPGQEKKGRC